MKEQFNFSIHDDQKKFDILPDSQKKEIINSAESEAIKINMEINDEKFKKAVPVEEIIPNIKNVKKVEIDNSDKSKGRSMPHDFWRWYLKDKFLMGLFTNNLIVKKDKEYRLKDNTTDVLGYPNIITSIYKEENVGLKLFNGQVVVDLGAGHTASGYLLSELMKARAYIGVDLYNTNSLNSDLEKLDFPGDNKAAASLGNELKSYPGVQKHHIPFSIVKDDMLSFLKRLPDNSVSITMSGIDRSVIEDVPYRQDVLKEIERVLDPNGGFLSSDSFISDFDTEVISKLDTVYKRYETGIEVLIYQKKKDTINEKK
jgi:hypothetical protein